MDRLAPVIGSYNYLGAGRTEGSTDTVTRVSTDQGPPAGLCTGGVEPCSAAVRTDPTAGMTTG